MFPKQVLIGIIISKAVFEIRFSRSDKSKIGYSVLPSICIRGDEGFLLDIQRSLYQHQVKSLVKQQESKTRQKPIMRISGIKNTNKVIQMIPDSYSDANSSLSAYKGIILRLVNKEHLTLEGLESIMKIRGILNGTDIN